MQREHAVLGFGFAVVRKHVDDGGGREAALITYYGFLSVFPMLLVGVAVLSQVLVADAELRRDLVEAIVPPTLQDDVERSVADLPTSPVAFVVGVVGLLVTAAGVVVSADRTLDHLAGVPYRLRAVEAHLDGPPGTTDGDRSRSGSRTDSIIPGA